MGILSWTGWKTRCLKITDPLLLPATSTHHVKSFLAWNISRSTAVDRLQYILFFCQLWDFVHEPYHVIPTRKTRFLQIPTRQSYGHTDPPLANVFSIVHNNEIEKHRTYTKEREHKTCALPECTWCMIRARAIDRTRNPPTNLIFLVFSTESKQKGHNNIAGTTVSHVWRSTTSSKLVFACYSLTVNLQLYHCFDHVW